MWFTYSDIHRLCSLHTSVKGGSDMAKKMLKALKINTIEICKYPFNVNGSVKHICICSYSWSHLILSKDFPPLFVYPLPYYCDHLLSRSRSSEVFNTWNLYPFMQRCVPLVRTERKVESLFFFNVSNRVMLLNGNTFAKFLFNTNHQNVYNNQVIWIELCNRLEIMNINTRSQDILAVR